MQSFFKVVFGCGILGGASSAFVSSHLRSPVEKVVRLLEDLQAKISQDGKAESQIYDKYACWCEKTSDAKAKAINDGQASLRVLGQNVLKYKGEVAVLSAEIAQLDKEMKANQESQAEATSIRQKENAAFQAETSELKQALAALQKAVKLLVDATTAFVQEDASASALRIAATLRDFIQALPSGLAMKQAHLTALSQLAASASYAPQSWTVQGILKDMYETFSSDLQSSTQGEAAANRNFEALIHTLSQEYETMQGIRTEKAGLKADAEVNLAQSTQSFDDTKAQMDADVKFFDATMDACSAKAADWKVRSDLRAEELRGISQALEILSSDSARELFASAIKEGKETGTQAKYDSGININPSFLQLAGSAIITPKNAYDALKAVASRTHSLRVAMLAVQVHESKVGHFEDVIKAIDEMMATLKAENSADVEKRDQCIDEYKNINSSMANIEWLIKNNEAKVDKLETIIDQENVEKAKVEEDISETSKFVHDLTVQRQEDNQAFLHAKDEDAKSIALLMEARKVLSSYYKNNNVTMGPIQGDVKGDSLLEQPNFEVSADQSPDADFSDKGYHKNEAKGIIQILTMIIEDLNDEIRNGMRDEEAAQVDYEKQKAAAEQLLSDLRTKEDNIKVSIALHKEEREAEKELRGSNQKDLEAKQEYQASIKSDCDWIIGAFKEREQKREVELNGLTQAKEFLAGYQRQQDAALLEQKPSKPRFSQLRFLSLTL